MTFCGVAISGKAGAGKTTLTKAVQVALNQVGRDSTILSFAEPIKSLSKAVLVELGLVQPGAAEDEWKYTFRGVPQVVGTHLRQYDENIWVALAGARVRSAAKAGIVILNDDARRLNELEELKSQGMFLVRIEATRELREARLGSLRNEQHITETDLDAHLDKFHLVLYQDAEHPVALPEVYAATILRMAGFSTLPTEQSVLP